MPEKHASGLTYEALLAIASMSKFGVGSLGRSSLKVLESLLDTQGLKGQAGEAVSSFSLKKSGALTQLVPNSSTLTAWYDALRNSSYFKKNYPDIDVTSLRNNPQKLAMFYGMLGAGDASGWKSIVKSVSSFGVDRVSGFETFQGRVRLSPNATPNDMMRAVIQFTKRPVNALLPTDIRRAIDRGIIPKSFLDQNKMTNEGIVAATTKRAARALSVKDWVQLQDAGFGGKLAASPEGGSGLGGIGDGGRGRGGSSDPPDRPPSRFKQIVATERQVRAALGGSPVATGYNRHDLALYASVRSSDLARSRGPLDSPQFGGPLGGFAPEDFGYSGRKSSGGRRPSSFDFWDHYNNTLSSHIPPVIDSPPAINSPMFGRVYPNLGGNASGFRSGSALYKSRFSGPEGSPGEARHADREVGREAIRRSIYELDKSIKPGVSNTGGPSSVVTELKKLNANTQQQTKIINDQKELTKVLVEELGGDSTPTKVPRKSKGNKAFPDISDENLSRLHAEAKQSGDFSDFEKHLRARRTADRLGKADHWSELMGGGGGPGGPGGKRRNRRQGLLGQIGTQFRHAAIWQAYSPALAAVGGTAYASVRPYETMEAIKYASLGATVGEQAVALGLGASGNANNPFRRTSEAINTSRMVVAGVGWSPTVQNQIKASRIGEVIEHVAKSSDIEPQALTQMAIRIPEVFKDTKMSQEELMMRTLGSIHKVGQLTSVKGPELQQAMAFGGPTLHQLFKSDPGEAIGFLTPFIAAGATNVGRAVTHMTSSNTLEKLALAQVQAIVNSSRMEQAGEDNAKYALDEKEIKKMIEGKNAIPEIRKLYKETLGDIADKMKTDAGLTGVLARHGAQVLWGIGASIDVPHADENVTRLALLANTLYNDQNRAMTQAVSNAAKSGFRDNAAQQSLDNQTVLSNAATDASLIMSDVTNVMSTSSIVKAVTAKIQRLTGPASYLMSINQALDSSDLSMADKKAVIEEHRNKWAEKIYKRQLTPHSQGMLPEDLINMGLENWGKKNKTDVSSLMLNLPEEAKNRKWHYVGSDPTEGKWIYPDSKKLRAYRDEAYEKKLLAKETEGFASLDISNHRGNPDNATYEWTSGMDNKTLGGVIVSALKSLKDALVQNPVVVNVSVDGQKAAVDQKRPPESTGTNQSPLENHPWF